jgi:hypothetical protein
LQVARASAAGSQVIPKGRKWWRVILLRKAGYGKRSRTCT